LLLIPHEGSPNESIFDEAVEFALAEVLPAQLGAATATDAISPCKAWEPRLFESRGTTLGTPWSAFEGDDFESFACRVYESQLVGSTNCESVHFICHVIEAPATKPSLVLGWRAETRQWSWHRLWG